MDKTKFTQQQLEMLERFKKLKVGALFSKMGTGKTRVAVELVNYNRPDFLLYVCPFSCKANIETELKKWGVECEYEIVGYETLSSSDRTYMRIRNKLQEHGKNFIIADESIFIKNGVTKRFKRCKDLRSLCQYALVLNGTPIVNNERDIYNQMQFLSEKIFNMTYRRFLDAFFIAHGFKTHDKFGNQKEFYTYDFYEPNRPAFSKIVAPYSYTAELMFDHEETTDFDWVGIDYDAYSDEKDKVFSRYSGYDTDCIIDLFTRLAGVAAEDSRKNAAVIKYITGKKVIVYCSRKKEVDQISKGCDCFVITGDTKTADRKRIVQDFTDCDDKPLILSFGVGAYSLNLQTASEIVYASLTFNYGQYEQSRYRIKRMGQDKDIQYTYILADCGITDMMYNNLREKRSLADLVQYHIEHGDTEEWISEVLNGGKHYEEKAG